MEKNLVLEIVRKYIDDKFSTMESISDSFYRMGINVSKSKVSEALHLAITQNIVNIETARAIAAKAISNSKRHSGYDKKIRQKYEELFFMREEFIKATQNNKQLEFDDIETTNINDFEDLPETQQSKDKKDFFLSTFSSSFGDADDFPIDTTTAPEELEENYIKYRKSLE